MSKTKDFKVAVVQAGTRDSWFAPMRHIALEGRCFPTSC